MKTINLILMTFILALTLPASAATIAYWNMADPGASNGAYMPGNGERRDLDGDGSMDADDFRIGSVDLSGNGNHLTAWTMSWMRWSSDSKIDGFSMVSSNDWPAAGTQSRFNPYITGVDVETWAPATWTIEAMFKPASKDITSSGNRTIIGRDGASYNPLSASQAVLYFGLRSAATKLAIQYADAAKVNHTLEYTLPSTFGNNTGKLVAGTWYHLAATSDGATLRLYLDGQLMASLDTAAASSNTALGYDTDLNGFSHNWTVCRGMWNSGDNPLSGHVDRYWGNVDAVALSEGALTPQDFVCWVNPQAAYSPNPQPLNVDGSVGTLNALNEAQLTLNFMAGHDPNTVRNYPVNPAILKHYILLGTDLNNLSLAATLDQVHNPDPMLTDPANSLALTVAQNTTYYWRVEEGLNKGNGTVYLPGDPNNIKGPAWSFKTVAAIPVISTHPKHTVADASGNASLSVKASATATTYRWFKVGTPDQQLSDIGIYSGTQTNTLSISGATIADEGRYYCIAYNDDPANGGTPSLPSNTVRLWTQRLIGHWKLDGDMADSAADQVPGAAAHDGVMNTGDPNYLAAGDSIVGTAMSFHNDGQYVTVADSDYYHFFREGFTMSCWFKDTGDDGWRVFYSKLDAGAAGWLFGKDATATTAAFIIDVPNIRLNTGSSVNVADGEWHMLTATYDAASDLLKMFVDGDQHAQGTIDLANAPLPAAPVAIGGLGTDAVNGAMDDVQMYTYALTPAQVAQVYLDIKPGSYICAEVENGIGAYDLNDDCRVNLADFALMAAEWLECQRVPASACNW